MCGPKAEITGSTPEEQKKALRDALTDKCLDDILVEAFAVVREASRAIDRHATLRCSAHRRNGSAPRARSPR